FFSGISLHAQNEYLITGTVIDSTTRTPLEAVSIFVPEIGSGTYTGIDGGFILESYTLPIIIRISYVGYSTRTIEINHEKDGHDIVIPLIPQGERINEIVVQSNSARERFASTNTSVENIDARVAEVLPALFGEVDIIKTLQLKPGISSGSEGSSSLFVRGGNGDQNLVMFDGVTIYN